MSALRRDARSLFAAAREDGPDADERDAVFQRVAVATGIAAGAAIAATAASAAPAAMTTAAKVAETAAGAGASAGVGATAGAFSMKLIALGALLGAVSTALCGLLVVTYVLPDEQPTSRTTSGSTPENVGEGSEVWTTSARTRGVASGARLGAPEVRVRDTADADARAKAAAEASAKAEGLAKANANTDPPSDLAEEARLVTAARTALVAGDAARALSLVQATRKLGARALEPEELGLEARALRALGRADDAAATELVLRRRYPESALAR